MLFEKLRLLNEPTRFVITILSYPHYMLIIVDSITDLDANNHSSKASALNCLEIDQTLQESPFLMTK